MTRHRQLLGSEPALHAMTYEKRNQPPSFETPLAQFLGKLVQEKGWSLRDCKLNIVSDDARSSSMHQELSSGRAPISKRSSHSICASSRWDPEWTRPEPQRSIIRSQSLPIHQSATKTLPCIPSQPSFSRITTSPVAVLVARKKDMMSRLRWTSSIQLPLADATACPSASFGLAVLNFKPPSEPSISEWINDSPVSSMDAKTMSDMKLPLPPSSTEQKQVCRWDNLRKTPHPRRPEKAAPPFLPVRQSSLREANTSPSITPPARR